MPKAVLKGLKRSPVKISAICAMLDSGGSSGRLRKDYGILSPGDIRRALVALAETSPAIESLFDYRFGMGQFRGHNFANLLILALELSTNNFEKTLKELKKILRIKHEVLPVTLDKSHLCAELENGEIIEGETNIDRPKHNGRLSIRRVFLKPKAKAYPKTIQALKRADLIVIGPGDLYSSLAQLLLTEGIAQTISKSKAKKIYICNLMTKYGETNRFSVSDFTNQIEKWLNDKLDFVFYNNYFPSKRRMGVYRRKHPELLEMVKVDNNLDKEKFIGRNFLYNKGPIEHDPQKTTEMIIKLCGPRRKFR